MNSGPELVVETFRRRARTEDGREIATLRCVRRGDHWVLECEVWPEGAEHGASLRPGPYVFRTEQEARGFADEATLALEYLGCEIS